MKIINNTLIVFGFSILSLVIVPTSNASIVQTTYEIIADNFLDSKNDPPQGAASTIVTGTYTFTFDTAQPSQMEITPDAVIGLDITDRNGSITDFDPTNSGVNTSLNIFTNSGSNNVGRITIGGNVNGVASIVGRSNDFRVQFDINLSDFQVTDVFEHLAYVTSVDPYYSSEGNTTTVRLLNVSQVPIPASFWLFGTALLGLLGKRIQKLDRQ